MAYYTADIKINGKQAVSRTHQSYDEALTDSMSIVREHIKHDRDAIIDIGIKEVGDEMSEHRSTLKSLLPVMRVAAIMLLLYFATEAILRWA